MTYEVKWQPEYFDIIGETLYLALMHNYIRGSGGVSIGFKAPKSICVVHEGLCSKYGNENDQ